MTMKSTCLSLLSALAFCCIAGAANAQDIPANPPVKMGLWETTIVSTIGGITIPPDVAARLQAMGRPVPGGPHTVTTQSCMTKDEWAKAFEKMNSNGENKCTYTNRTITAQKISFDMSCTSERGGVFTGHFEMLIDDDEHSHGTAHMKGEGGQRGQPMTIDTTMTSHYLSAECGEVKPGDAKILKNQ